MEKSDCKLKSPARSHIQGLRNKDTQIQMPNYNPQKTTNREKENKNECYLQDRNWGASRNKNKQWDNVNP
jgi:hypothetical protein